MATAAKTPGRGLFYGWYIVAAATLNGAAIIGMTIYGFGVFLPSIRDDMGWSTAAIAFGFTLQRIENGLFSPLVGYATDRAGPRRVTFIGVTLVVVGFLFLASVQHLWQFYIAAVIISLGQSMGSLGPFSAAIMHWFRRHRARAVSFMMAGTGLGAFTVYPLNLIVEAFGWRGALVAAAVLVFVVGYTSAFILRDRPESMGLQPDGDRESAAEVAARASASTYGLTAGQALKSYAFWLLLGAWIAFGFTNLIWVVLQFPALQEKGFSSGEASLAISAYGVMIMIMRVLLGVVGDRIGRRRMFIIAFPLQAAGMAAFALAQDHALHLVPYYLIYSVGHSMYVVTSQTIVADYFGTRRFATIRGWLGGIGSVGGATGPVIGAWIAESAAGGYTTTFAVVAIVCAVAIPFVVLADVLRPRIEDVPVAAPAGA